ncbi:MAG: DNA adenine methylase, partial [Candidatus Poseidoniales archaeon]
FLGGGSVSIHVTKKYPHLKVWVNDLYGDLYNFWKHLQSDGDQMSEDIRKLKIDHPDPETAKKLFLECREFLEGDNDKYDRAVRFWCVNKLSFSGLTQSSSFSAASSTSNWTLRSIDNLKEYGKLIKNWKITNLSYEELLKQADNAFVYLDPPYDIKDALYGKKGSMHKGFDHDQFAKYCNESKADQLISYNSDQWVKERFSEETWTHEDFNLTYTMRSTGDYMKNQQKRKELVMYNYKPHAIRLDELFS